MTPEIQESHDQFLLFWKKMIRAMDTPEIDSEAGLDFVYGNVPIPFFNGVFLFEPVAGGEELEKRLKRALAFAGRRNVPWFLFAWDDATPGDLRADRDRSFGEAGLVPALTLTGMAADVRTLPAANPVPDLDLRLAEAPSGHAAIGEINAVAYEMGSGAGVGTMDRPGLFEGGYPMLGYRRGEAVSCAHTAPVDGRLYVAFVATVPTERRKGYAEACMRQSLVAASAATGLTRSFLHATDAGLPIYARMGYRPVTSYTLFGQAH